MKNRSLLNRKNMFLKENGLVYGLVILIVLPQYGQRTSLLLDDSAKSSFTETPRTPAIFSKVSVVVLLPDAILLILACDEPILFAKSWNVIPLSLQSSLIRYFIFNMTNLGQI